MVGKSNLPADVENRTDVSGSSLRRYANALDQERAASMADEGGAAGMIADTRDQEWTMPAAPPGRLRTRARRARPLLIGVIALGLAALAAALWLRRHA